MGDLITKVALKNSCVNFDESVVTPRYHFKCRHDDSDEYCPTNIYTRTKDVIVRTNIFIFEQDQFESRFLNFSYKRGSQCQGIELIGELVILIILLSNLLQKKYYLKMEKLIKILMCN